MKVEIIQELGFEELEKRSLEIAEETATADSEKLEALNAELDAIEKRKSILETEVEARKKAAEEVAKGNGKEIETRKEKEKMTNSEVRNSKEYIEAFARYIKTGKDMECRELLTENVENMGTVPVPEIVEGTVRHAWEKNELLDKIRKSYIKGNLKISFEQSSSPAEIHPEGGNAIDEEELVLGIVNLVPQTVKKWISFSTEVSAMGAEEFLRYIYEELTYRIIKAVADGAVQYISQTPTTPSSSYVAIPQMTGDASTASIIGAEGLLGGEASDIVVICNRATAAAIKSGSLYAGFAYDPFDGATVIYSDALDSYADAAADEVFMIVGDLAGFHANFPEGDAVKFIYDEYTLAPSDLIRVVGRLYVGFGVTAPGMFVNITKPGD